MTYLLLLVLLTEETSMPGSRTTRKQENIYMKSRQTAVIRGLIFDANMGV